MKIADVVVGETYETKVSGFRAAVVVRRATEDHSGRKRFEVSRPETPLKIMRRTAAALHERKRSPKADPAPTSSCVPCRCRDCMETAIGDRAALCHACADAGCDNRSQTECLAAADYSRSEE